jgi:hypothetical protein
MPIGVPHHVSKATPIATPWGIHNLDDIAVPEVRKDRLKEPEAGEPIEGAFAY